MSIANLPPGSETFCYVRWYKIEQTHAPELEGFPGFGTITPVRSSVNARAILPANASPGCCPMDAESVLEGLNADLDANLDAESSIEGSGSGYLSAAMVFPAEVTQMLLG